MEIKRLSGLSNACFRVKIKDQVATNVKEPRTLLYRRFEQELTDRRIEEAIFKTKSEDGTGPKLYFMNNDYRIEGFFEGRPISIWEMRNPLIYLDYARFICDYNFNSVAQKRIMEFKQMDENDLFIHQVLRDWGPTLQSKLKDMKLALQKPEGHEERKKENIR